VPRSQPYARFSHSRRFWRAICVASRDLVFFAAPQRNSERAREGRSYCERRPGPVLTPSDRRGVRYDTGQMVEVGHPTHIIPPIFFGGERRS
jgi:hypothetical protein